MTLPLSPEAAAARPKRLVGGLALTALVVTVLWPTPVLLPLRLLVTFVHEAGHALAANLVGGDVVSLTINPNEGGLTFSRFEATRPRRMLVASAGYVGATLIGAALLAALRHLRTGRAVLASFAVGIALATVLWVRSAPDPGAFAGATGSGRNDGWFTLLFSIFAVVVFGGLAWKATVGIRRAAVTLVAAGLCFGALEDVWQLVGSGNRRHSDAETLADLTFLPSVVWAVLWLLVGLVVVTLSVVSLVRAGRPAVATVDP